MELEQLFCEVDDFCKEFEACFQIQALAQTKNISQIVHTRHRSISNFMVNLVAGLIAYTHQPKKPSLQLPKTAKGLLFESVAF
ncbi:MAG TPA: hypothetical protein V6C95_11640 [Coleofasciculaceae cyanobacterium]